MRTTARISLCALALLAAGIAGCRDDDRLSYEKDAQEGDVPPIGVQSISVLKSLYHDRTTRITQEISIQGHIVANDTAGEFYKEIVVEDDTGGIVLSIDDERLYRTCRLFDFVTINCQGLALGSEGGTLLDTAGRQFVVRTDRRCDYARKPLPAGEGTLCGIVEYFNGRYRLRITNHEILFDRQ